MKINFRLNLKTIFLILVCVWGIFAVWYIANDQWQDFKINENQQAYQLGRSDTIKAVIDEVSKCQQLPLSIDDKKANVVSIECLQQNQNSQQNTQNQTQNLSQ